MSDQTQDEVVTLDALRAAAKAILRKPWVDLDLPDWYVAMYEYEAARAEFWRLVAKWEINSGNTEFSELDEVRAIIAEVEART